MDKKHFDLIQFVMRTVRNWMHYHNDQYILVFLTVFFRLPKIHFIIE